MTYGLSHLQHASRIGAEHTWFFNRIDEWASKRDAIIVLQADMPAMLLAAKNRPTVPHPTNPKIQTFDPTTDIRLMIACESIVNSLYSAAEIAANFANLASKGTIPNSFNKIRQKCEGDNLKEACTIIGNTEIIALQHYQMLRPQFMESAIERDQKAREGAQKGAQPNQETAGNERKAKETPKHMFDASADQSRS